MRKLRERAAQVMRRDAHAHLVGVELYGFKNALRCHAHTGNAVAFVDGSEKATEANGGDWM